MNVSKTASQNCGLNVDYFDKCCVIEIIVLFTCNTGFISNCKKWNYLCYCWVFCFPVG